MQCAWQATARSQWHDGIQIVVCRQDSTLKLPSGHQVTVNMTWPFFGTQ